MIYTNFKSIPRHLCTLYRNSDFFECYNNLILSIFIAYIIIDVFSLYLSFLGGAMALKSLRCPNCNAVISTFDETTKKGFCPFCDSIIIDVQERQNDYATESRKALIIKEADFIIRGDVLEKYNGEDVDVIIPNGVYAIGESAFQHSAIKKVVIPDSVEEIRNHAFYGCKNLEIASLTEVTEIGDYAFTKCSKLTSVQFPHKPLKIGCGAFQDCPKLMQVEFFDLVSFTLLDLAFDSPDLVFDCTPLIRDNEDGVYMNADLLYECRYGERNNFPEVISPSLKKIIFSNFESANQTCEQLSKYLLDTVVQSFDAAIRREESEKANVGLFGKKKKEEHQRRINNLRAAKKLLPAYCLQIEIRE